MIAGLDVLRDRGVAQPLARAQRERPVDPHDRDRGCSCSACSCSWPDTCSAPWTEWSRSAELSVYLRDEATARPSAPPCGARSRADPSVAAVEFVSKDAALARFRRDFPELAPAADPARRQPVSGVVRSPPRRPAGRRRRPRTPGGPRRARCRAWPTSGTTGAGSIGWRRSASFVRWAGLLLAAVLVLAAGAHGDQRRPARRCTRGATRSRSWNWSGRRSRSSAARSCARG